MDSKAWRAWPKPVGRPLAVTPAAAAWLPLKLFRFTVLNTLNISHRISPENRPTVIRFDARRSIWKKASPRPSL